MKIFKSYLLYVRHAATGEGSTHSCALVFAPTKNEALREFLKKTMLEYSTDKKHFEEGVKYFGYCTQIWNLRAKKDRKAIREALAMFLTPNVIDRIIEAEDAHALHEFSFHLYRNFS